jgi:hypothetical protein
MTIASLPVHQAISNTSIPDVLQRSLGLEAIQPSSPRRGTLPPINTEDYQVALVPVQSARGWNRNAKPHDKLEGILLLPLTWKELITRVSTEMGISDSIRPDDVAYFGQVRIDFLSMEVVRADRLVKLTPMEFKVLRFFLFNRNRVITRDELLNEVWGYESYPCTRTVDNHVLKLRQKLEPRPSHPVHFRTAHGMGYRFVP